MVDAELKIGNVILESKYGWPEQQSVFLHFRSPIQLGNCKITSMLHHGRHYKKMGFTRIQRPNRGITKR